MTEKNDRIDEADIKVWDELWASAHLYHYQCYYEELTAEFLVGRWRLVDTVTKFLTTITASTSAIAAWAVWVSSSFNAIIWAIISGAAALLSILHISLGISDRIKEDTLIYSTFLQLRIDLEQFKVNMRIKSHDSLSVYKKEYMDILSKFGKANALKRPDFFITEKREKLIQADLNKRMGF
jgi:hypothetical protein